MYNQGHIHTCANTTSCQNFGCNISLRTKKFWGRQNIASCKKMLIYIFYFFAFPYETHSRSAITYWESIVVLVHHFRILHNADSKKFSIMEPRESKIHKGCEIWLRYAHYMTMLHSDNVVYVSSLSNLLSWF